MSAETAGTIVKAPSPPSPFMAFWNAFRENRGAVVGLVVLALILALGIFAPLFTHYDPISDRFATKLPPVWAHYGDVQGSWEHWLGTDPIGRDMWARIIYGSRLSIFIGVAVMVISTFIGIVIGLICAYVGGLFDVIVLRIMDLIMAIPDLVLAIMIIAVIGPNLTNTIVAITIVFLPRYVRLVRAAAQVELSKDYVTAAKVTGVRPFRLMLTSVLPNCLAPMIVQGALGVSDAMLEAAGLGFLGLGAQPPLPEWGSMLGDTRDLMSSQPWVTAMPGIAILITVLAINLMGDGLRDALDPRLRRS
ncbi:ABC transporter permease [Aestuariivirga litoralis]|uniref:ABC transporter permease n=1 Tax=Aestuariivirga litoralis TaxID=2650924 RepID=UPI0018C7AFB8|nr:ABC transporter permease subunit [Aestuariivirga litoralis]MBG1232533.1 ABC transporter permease subunit [Aestuariivirga litoralis]